MMRTDGTIESTTDQSGIYKINSSNSTPNPIPIPPGEKPPADSRCDCECHNVESNVFIVLIDAAIPTIPCVECRCWDGGKVN